MSCGPNVDMEDVEGRGDRLAGGEVRSDDGCICEVGGGGVNEVERGDGQTDGRNGKEIGGILKEVDSSDKRDDVMMEKEVIHQPQKVVKKPSTGMTNFFRKKLPGSSRKDRQFYENLPLEKKRTYYKHKKFVTLGDIETWSSKRQSQGSYKKKPHSTHQFNPFPLLDRKISLWQGDITRLEIGAIVNAANSSLLGGGGVDGAIHRAAGSSLSDECRTLNGCHTGQTKLTSGHALPAKYVLHTVGPTNRSKGHLESCYRTCLDLVEQHNIRTVAFCCIATGIYGYPNGEAADIALTIVRKWLEANAEKVDRIIFCVFLDEDLRIYLRKLCQYFPSESDEEDDEKEEEVGEEMEVNREEKEVIREEKEVIREEKNRPKKTEESDMSGEASILVTTPDGVTKSAQAMRISVKVQEKEEEKEIDVVCSNVKGKEEKNKDGGEDGQQKKKYKKENHSQDETMESSLEHSGNQD